MPLTTCIAIVLAIIVTLDGFVVLGLCLMAANRRERRR